MKQKTTEEMRSVIKSFSTYTGTKKAFFQERNINIHTFNYWQTKFNKQSSKSSSKKFIPLQVEKPGMDKIELFYPNGVRLVFPIDTHLKVLQGLVKSVS